MTELALIIGVIGLALISMEIYFKRGVSGKLKDLTDVIIGNEQEIFQQDTSGLETNNSFSTMNADTETAISTNLGGGRATVATENTVTVYNSIAEDF